MKKTKRILTVAMAAAVVAISCSSMFSVSAATQYNAYRYYFNVSAGAEIDAYNANISHSPSSVIYADSAKGNLDGTFTASDVSVTASRSVTYINYTNSSPSSKSGYLGTVTLKTLTIGAPTVNVTLISGTNTTNTVTVDKVLLGDLNFDNQIDQEDVRMINLYLSQIVIFNSEQFKAADINDNGYIDDEDAIRISCYVNGATDSVLG